MKVVDFLFKGSSSSAPAPAPTPAPIPIPQAEDPVVSAADKQKAEDEQLKARGRAATILNNSSSANTASKTLLG